MKQIPTATAIPPRTESRPAIAISTAGNRTATLLGQHRPLQQPRWRGAVHCERRVPWAKPAVKAVGDEPSVALLEERSAQVHPSGCLSHCFVALNS